MKLEQKDEQRFWSKVDKSQDCWIWTSQLRGGYGIFRYQGKIWGAHRLSYALVNELKAGYPICHHCDNRQCVNPNHLYQGTYQTNSDDKMNRDRHNFTLSNDQVRAIRSEPVSNTMVRDIADKYKISRTLVKYVLTGQSYSHIPGAISIPPQFTGRLLTVEQLQEIQEALSNPYWGQQTALAKKYGVQRATINHIAKNRLKYTDTK